MTKTINQEEIMDERVTPTTLEQAIKTAARLADQDAAPVLIMENPGFGYVVELRTDV